VHVFFIRLSYLDQPTSVTKDSSALQLRVFCTARKCSSIPFSLSYHDDSPNICCRKSFISQHISSQNTGLIPGEDIKVAS